MPAININLSLEQGTDYSVDFTIQNDNDTPLNLTGYASSCFMRKTYTSTILYPFTVSFVDRLAGEISLGMGRSITSQISEGRYVYDITLTSVNDIRTRVIQGNVLVNPGVTI
jgi:hypothetical protein